MFTLWQVFLQVRPPGPTHEEAPLREQRGSFGLKRLPGWDGRGRRVRVPAKACHLHPAEWPLGPLLGRSFEGEESHVRSSKASVVCGVWVALNSPLVPVFCVVPKPLPWACVQRTLLAECVEDLSWTVWSSSLVPVVGRLQGMKTCSLNVLCVRNMPWDEMTTSHFPGGWGLRLRKKKGTRGGREWAVRTTEWWGVCVGWGALPLWEDCSVRCSSETCNVSSSLFDLLQQSSCYPLYKLCIYKYNTWITFPYKTKVMHGLGNYLLFHF